VPGIDELLDQLDDRADVFARERLMVGPSQLQRIGVLDVGLGHAGGQLDAPDRGLPSRLVDLVVNVRDV
jgi:hypothetical protein